MLVAHNAGTKIGSQWNYDLYQTNLDEHISMWLIAFAAVMCGARHENDLTRIAILQIGDTCTILMVRMNMCYEKCGVKSALRYRRVTNIENMLRKLRIWKLCCELCCEKCCKILLRLLCEKMCCAIVL